MLRSFALAVTLSWSTVGMLACGGDTEGAECESADDCDDGQVCAALATCAPGASCPAICGVPCEVDADCSEGEICAETTGSSPTVCQDSRVIEDF